MKHKIRNIKSDVIGVRRVVEKVGQDSVMKKWDW